MLNLLTRPRALLFLCNMLFFFVSDKNHDTHTERCTDEFHSFNSPTWKKNLLNLRFFCVCVRVYILCLCLLSQCNLLVDTDFCLFWLCLPLPGSGMAWLYHLCSRVCAYVVIIDGCSSLRIWKKNTYSICFIQKAIPLNWSRRCDSHRLLLSSEIWTKEKSNLKLILARLL